MDRGAPEGDLFPPVLCIAQDAGAASVIRPVLRALRDRGAAVRALAAQPAFDLLVRTEGPDLLTHLAMERGTLRRQIETSLDVWRPRVLVVGTGHPECAEQWATIAARSRSLPVLAILDSWCSYEERFSGVSADTRLLFLPDEVAVMDEGAREELIRTGIPARQISVTGHPGLDELARLIATPDSCRSARARLASRLRLKPELPWILFVSDNLAEISRKFPKLNPGYTEKDAFDLLLSVLWRHAQREFVLIVRKHPGEYLQKYPRPSACPPWLRFDDGAEDSRDLILASDMITGIGSILLVEAFLIGKPVISLQLTTRLYNDFVLSRRGWVHPVGDADGLEAALRGGLASREVAGPRAATCAASLLDGRATERVLGRLASLLNGQS